MSCVLMSTLEHAPALSQPLLASLLKSLCWMRGLVLAVVNNPVTAEAYIGFSDAVDNGVLAAITLAVARAALSLFNNALPETGVHHRAFPPAF